MRSIITGGLAALALAGLASAAEAKCMKATGQATAITDELATALAKDALSASISTWGGKGAGKIRTSCKLELVFSTCNVQQRACK
jgi:hypothetical protein